MDSVKYIGMDVHKEAISIAVLNSSGKHNSDYMSGIESSWPRARTRQLCS